MIIFVILIILSLIFVSLILYLIFRKNNNYDVNKNSDNKKDYLCNFIVPVKVCSKRDDVKSFLSQPKISIVKKNNTKIIPHSKRSIIKIPSKTQATITNLPQTFSWRKVKPLQIEDPRNQGDCGGCYAFAFASVMGDRLSLRNNIQSIYPSTAYILSLRVFDETCKSGCDGGNTYYVYQDILKNKEKLEKCWPYKIIQNSDQYGCTVLQSDEWVSPQNLQNSEFNNCCYDCCQGYLPNNLSSVTLEVLKDSYFNFADNYDIPSEQKNWKLNEINSMISDIKREIYSNGPVLTSFPVLENFNQYRREYAISSNLVYINNCKSNFIKDGVYDCQYQGGHAVVITGWGQAVLENGETIDFWEIRNSWGKTDTNDGYFKVKMSDFTNQEYWLGFDIPRRLLKSRNKSIYESYGGAEYFKVGPINNLDNLTNIGVFNKIKV